MWRLVGQLPVKPGKSDVPLSLWDFSQRDKYDNHIIDSLTQIPIDSISYFLNFFDTIFNFFSTILNFFGTKLKFPRHWINFFGIKLKFFGTKLIFFCSKLKCFSTKLNFLGTKLKFFDVKLIFLTLNWIFSVAHMSHCNFVSFLNI